MPRPGTAAAKRHFSHDVIHRNCDGPDPHCDQWPAGLIRTGGSFRPAGAAEGSDAAGGEWLPPRAGAGRRSRAFSLHGADRHHPHRDYRRRFLRRHACRPAGRLAAEPGSDGTGGRAAGLRLGGHAHHLSLAHHRRARAQADRLAQSGEDRLSGCAGNDAALPRRLAARFASGSFGQAGAGATGSARGPREPRH